MIDASHPADEQWHAIDAELAAYGAGLDELPQIVVLNKIDLEPDADLRGRRRRGSRPCSGSRARPARGSRSSGRRSSRSCPSLPPVVAGEATELADFLVYRPQPKARSWSLLRTEDGFRVVGTPPGRGGARAGAPRGGRTRGASAVEVGDESFEFVP